MSPVAEILWEAAADVEQPSGGWVRGVPGIGERCAVTAIWRDLKLQGNQRKGVKILRWSLGLEDDDNGWCCVSNWNYVQPSRAVVAAAMRDAAFLAEWAGPHLLKPKP